MSMLKRVLIKKGIVRELEKPLGSEEYKSLLMKLAKTKLIKERIKEDKTLDIEVKKTIDLGFNKLLEEVKKEAKNKEIEADPYYIEGAVNYLTNKYLNKTIDIEFYRGNHIVQVKVLKQYFKCKTGQRIHALVSPVINAIKNDEIRTNKVFNLLKSIGKEEYLEKTHNMIIYTPSVENYLQVKETTIETLEPINDLLLNKEETDIVISIQNDKELVTEYLKIKDKIPKSINIGKERIC